MPKEGQFWMSSPAKNQGVHRSDLLDEGYQVKRQIRFESFVECETRDEVKRGPDTPPEQSDVSETIVKWTHVLRRFMLTYITSQLPSVYSANGLSLKSNGSNHFVFGFHF